MFYADHASRRPEIGDYNFMLGVADRAVATTSTTARYRPNLDE